MHRVRGMSNDRLRADHVELLAITIRDVVGHVHVTSMSGAPSCGTTHAVSVIPPDCSKFML